jgi:hypothetical protein
MNTAIRTLSLMALCCAASVGAVAQQQAAPAPGQATAPPMPATPPAGAPATATPPAAAPAAKPAQATAQSEAGDPRADTSNEPAKAPAPPATPGPSADRAQAASRGSAGHAAPAASGSGQKGAPKTDRLDLGTATVTGDREQPKVMYIVPWKRSDIGDLAGKPMNSLVDEILAPVDRDVFKREVIYYHAVQDDTSQNGAPPKPGQQGEK